MQFTEKEKKEHKIIIWGTLLPLILAMAIPAFLNYLATVVYKPVLY